MGDRGNIVVQDDYGPAPVYLYSHWGGTELPDILAAALERGQGRWSDAPYLTRIIFNQMTAGDEMSETGFGISTKLTDNEYPLLVVDTRKGVVRVAQEGGDLDDGPEVPFAEATGKALRLARDGARV